jgi:hypothetical protein
MGKEKKSSEEEVERPIGFTDFEWKMEQTKRKAKAARKKKAEQKTGEDKKRGLSFSAKGEKKKPSDAAKTVSNYFRGK